MQINTLKRDHPNMKRMQVARGGKRGKTAGRGGKGQTARAGNKRRPEWRDIIKRLPKLRGRGKNSNKTVKTEIQKPVAVNLVTLENNFAAGSAITPTVLVEKGFVLLQSGRVPRVKILGEGEVTKSFKVSGCFVSESAKSAIEKVGGSVALVPAQEAAIAAAAAPKVEAVEKKVVEKVEVAVKKEKKEKVASPSAPKTPKKK